MAGKKAKRKSKNHEQPDPILPEAAIDTNMDLVLQLKTTPRKSAPKRASKRNTGPVASQSKVPDEVAPKKVKAAGKKNTQAKEAPEEKEVEQVQVATKKKVAGKKNTNGIAQEEDEAIPDVKSCEICNKTFKNTQNKQLHIESVHEGKKPFKCSMCIRIR